LIGLFCLTVRARREMEENKQVLDQMTDKAIAQLVREKLK
jgi:hypothetical protein